MRCVTSTAGSDNAVWTAGMRIRGTRPVRSAILDEASDGLRAACRAEFR